MTSITSIEQQYKYGLRIDSVYPLLSFKLMQSNFMMIIRNHNLFNMAIKLYWYLRSQPARAVKALLDLGKVPYEPIWVNLAKGKTRTEDYLKMNPYGQVPFLVDGETSIAESNAILVYLCETRQKELGRLYGSTAQERAKVNEKLSWFQAAFRPALTRIMFMMITEGFKNKQTIYREDYQKAEVKMMEKVGDLNDLISRSRTHFVSGNQLRIADLQFFFEMTDLIMYRNDFSQYGHLWQWWNRMLQVKEISEIHNEWLKGVPKVVEVFKSIQLKQKLS